MKDQFWFQGITYSGCKISKTKGKERIVGKVRPRYNSGSKNHFQTKTNRLVHCEYNKL